MKPRRYAWGSDLPPELQREALRIYRDRYTGDHRPAWLSSPNVGSERSNGPPDFEDDNQWLANTEFPIAGNGRTLRLSRNPSAPRVHYVNTPVWAHGQVLTVEEAQTVALAIARTTGKPIWVLVEGSRIGDITFYRPNAYRPSWWRLATPSGEIW